MNRLLYSDDFLIQTFGTTEPTVTERTNVFHQLWLDWESNCLKINLHSVRKTLNNIGLREFEDFQFRNGEIRFRRAEDLAMAKLVLGEQHV